MNISTVDKTVDNYHPKHQHQKNTSIIIDICLIYGVFCLMSHNIHCPTYGEPKKRNPAPPPINNYHPSPPQIFSFSPFHLCHKCQALSTLPLPLLSYICYNMQMKEIKPGILVRDDIEEISERN